MNKHTIAYMQTHDMDLIFVANNKLYHCATNGSLLPQVAREIKKFNRVRNGIIRLNDIFSIENLKINENKIKIYIEEQQDLINQYNRHQTNTDNRCNLKISDSLVRQNYLSSFLALASKGLYSYDYIGSDMRNDIIIEAYEFVVGPNDDFKQSDSFDIEELVNKLELPDLTNCVDFDGDKLLISLI